MVFIYIFSQYITKGWCAFDNRNEAKIMSALL